MGRLFNSRNSNADPSTDALSSGAEEESALPTIDGSGPMRTNAGELLPGLSDFNSQEQPPDDELVDADHVARLDVLACEANDLAKLEDRLIFLDLGHRHFVALQDARSSLNAVG